MEKETEKRWVLFTVALLCGLLIVLGGFTAVVDPYFHYHKPLTNLEYPFGPERYINDGIGRNFEYEAIITGTSMTQNFRSSEFESLWGVKTVKTPFAGASYKEIDEYLARTLQCKKGVRYVLRGLDYSYLLKDKDEMRYDLDFYPTYLYDENLFNDVKYLLNKSVLLEGTCRVMEYTDSGKKTTSFDDYSRWQDRYVFGKEAVLATYTRPEMSTWNAEWDEETEKRLVASLEQNVLATARENPDVTFYLFFTPYSIAWWDSLNRSGGLEQHIEAERKAIELLLTQENIELYSFSNNFPLVCDFNNYKDIQHYSADINSQILKWIHTGEYRLTEENYENYLKEILEFYKNYDYDSIME